ncbi:MAG: hypothetical protein KJ941_07350, partial [Bacteroidetes bacterium]|nr:hypothetical protein [Bacteroidota bacterium]
MNRLRLLITVFFFGTLFQAFGSTNAAPPTVTGNLVVCEGQTTVLTASVIPANPAVTYLWYDAPLGGNLLFSGNPYTTPPITGSQIIYVASVEGGTPSIIRTPVSIVMINNVDVASASSNPATVCPNEPVVLTGSSVLGATNFNWYDAPIAGNLLHTGPTFTTSAPITTTLFVASVNNSGCVSPRGLAPIVVVPNIDVPLGTANPPVACPGDNIALTATSVTGSTIFNWYDDATAGNLLFTGAIYNTSVNQTTFFYLATENANGCASLRTPVLVTILPNLDVPIGVSNPPVVCPGQTAVLTGTS